MILNDIEARDTTLMSLIDMIPLLQITDFFGTTIGLNIKNNHEVCITRIRKITGSWRTISRLTMKTFRVCCSHLKRHINVAGSVSVGSAHNIL